MQTQQTPQVLEQPFAAQGDKNTIPNAATGTNKASLQEGFPPITGQPINQGGIPPERQDFNGAMNLNSQFYFAFQNGWWPTFTQEVSDAIGGYPQGAVLWLFDTENNVYTPLLSLVGNNTYNFNTNKDYIGQYWAKILPDSGRGLPLGAVYFSSSSNADDNPGALPLWSGAYYTNASTLYPAFYAWVKSHTELCKTKTEYDAAISTYGECPYYVVDEVAGSLRLPKLVNYLKMANATDGITQSGAGLPNITGSVSGIRVGTFTAEGALSSSKTTGKTSQTMDNVINQNDAEVILDASNSSAVYGKSDEVTPAHTTAFPWVVSTASDAESSAAAAAQSADAAAASAINASNSAEAAENSATAAAGSASAAESSATNAQTYANTATTQATEAADSAGEAASSASAAASSASAASGSANTATTQANNAADSAALAQKWATQTTEEVVSGQGYGAKYYADQAANSAASASTSAGTATTKATEASDSASAAAQSAIDAANSAASIDPDKLIPVGALMMGPVAAMTGYILCDGRAVSRTQYSALFAAIGTNFGAGDGSNTFNVPDYRGCFLRMAGGSAGSMYQKQPQGLPDVVGTFAVNAGGKYTGAFSGGKGDSYNLYGTSSDLTQFHSSASNSIYGAANEVRPVNFAVNYFIKY